MFSGGVVEGQRLGEQHRGPLRGAIDGRAGLRPQAADAGVEQYGPASLPLHMRYGVAAGIYQCHHVHAEDASISSSCFR